VTAEKTKTLPIPPIFGAIALAGGIVLLTFVGKKVTGTDLQHGCRAEYGPLELRIQTSASINRFTIYVEDPRLEHRIVYEQAVQSTLESAKEYVVLRAYEYLNSYKETAVLQAGWRCS
jgi:hypothetical protein